MMSDILSVSSRCRVKIFDRSYTHRETKRMNMVNNDYLKCLLITETRPAWKSGV